MSNCRRCLLVLLLSAPVAGPRLQAALPESEAPDAHQTARTVERTLAAELPDRKVSQLADDATFLRRVFLDLVGQIPTPEEVLAFGLDDAPRKRSVIVETLLADAAFGENWARYWRDVIMFRRTDPRAALSAQSLENYLRAAFNANVSWDAIARDFITATGDVRENGQAALIMCQGGKPEEVVAEVSRIFLGIQIQCAQCHDHPTDRWQRQQFHELAAFFPRVAVSPKRNVQPRSFEVTVTDMTRRRRRNNNNRTIGTLEHYMPDLDEPTSRGTKTQPVFFLTGDKLPFGTTDADRRRHLANLITTRDNPWFARAFVNRVWAELVGEGFCEPIDDIGPDREGSTPETHDLLATAFAANEYDVKWLFRMIVETQDYQRASRSRREYDDHPFEANCPQRLRGDQLYDALVAALGVTQRPAQDQRRQGAYGRGGGPRGLFNSAFGFDPSDPRSEVKGSIQQALVVMNGTFIANAIASRRGGVLSTILATHQDDRAALIELYLHTLSRVPTDAELRTGLNYVQEIRGSAGSRREPFEDLQWALVNCTEFLYRK